MSIIDTSARVIEFSILGRPQQRGSKTPWIPRRKDGSMVTDGRGRPVIATMDSNKNSKEWMNLVRDKASEAMHREEMFDEPIVLTVRFFFSRPASHFGSGRNAGRLKPSAPIEYAQQPDLSKLLRCIEDGMNAIVYRDDRQICRYGEETGKYWTDGTPRAEVAVCSALLKY